MHAQEEVAVTTLVIVMGPAVPLRIIGLLAAIDRAGLIGSHYLPPLLLGLAVATVPLQVSGSVTEQTGVVHSAVVLRINEVAAALI